MTALTPRSYRKAKLHYQAYKRKGLDKTKRLFHYIEDELLRKVVENESRIGSELSKTLNYDRVYELD